MQCAAVQPRDEQILFRQSYCRRHREGQTRGPSSVIHRQQGLHTFTYFQHSLIRILLDTVFQELDSHQWEISKLMFPCAYRYDTVLGVYRTGTVL